MAELHKSCATLRIHGDLLDPGEVSRILGCSPTQAYRKGDVQFRTRLYKTGGWLLCAADQEPGDLDAQVSELFSRVTKDLSAWSSLSKQFEFDLFWLLHGRDRRRGLRFRRLPCKSLAERSIKLGICLYAPIKDFQPTDPCPCAEWKDF